MIANTTDIWLETYSNRSYVSLSCAYITSDFKLRKVLYVTDEFPYLRKTKENIAEWYTNNLPKPEKKHTVTADNASNNNMLCNRISCSAHCINLVVHDMISCKDAIELVQLIKAVKSLVTWWEKSGLSQRLPKSLKQSISIRWNSELTMLKSVSEIWEELTTEIVTTGDVVHLAGITKEMLDEVIKVLEPFLAATEDLEADKEPTLHRVLFWVAKLRRHLQPASGHAALEKAKEAGLQSLERKWVARLSPVHYAAAILDPRAKHSPILHRMQEKREEGLGYIRSQLALLQEIPSADNTNDDPAPNNIPEEDEDILYSCSSSQSQVETLRSDLDLYLQEPLANREVKPLSWWKDASNRLPLITRVARQVLSIPASSATSERAFSDAGYTINQRRVRLNPQNVDKLLFIRSACAITSFGDDDDY